MRKLGICANLSRGVTPEQTVEDIAAAGFDCFFTHWYDGDDAVAWASLAERYGLFIETLHAPYDDVNYVWTDGERGDRWMDVLCRCIDAAADSGVPVVVMHTTRKVVAPDVSAIGLVRWERAVKRAQARGVVLAFENLEHARTLGALMYRFYNCPAVGFCWDCGHQHCYADDDYMALYGPRLAAVHLHDNFGIKDKPVISTKDDLHLIPGDGDVRFDVVARKIARSGYDGPVTLEIKQQKNSPYEDIPPAQLFVRARAAAAALRDSIEQEERKTGR